MKHLKFLALLLLLSLVGNIQAQDCLSVNDTIRQCGYMWELDTLFQEAIWQVECEENKWVAIELTDSSTLFKFSECGYYRVIFFAEFCDQDTFVVNVFDESATDYSSIGNNDFSYSGVSCPSGGADCGNSVTILGGSYSSPSWEICQTLSCSSFEVSSIVYITDSTNCIVDSIEYLVDTESGSSSACWEGDQFAFIDIDPISGEVTNGFYDFIDSLNFNLLNEGLCPFVDYQCGSMPCEVDSQSVTYDTTYLEFPVHLGGQWTLIQNSDTILLDTLTVFEKDGEEYILEVLPHPRYFGPGNIDFSLFELDMNGDTIATSENIELIVFWQEQFTIDSLERIIPHYELVDSTCTSCGGNSVGFDYGAIPEIPDFPCGPISISFGDPCSCANNGIFVQGDEIIDCNTPCASLFVDLNGIQAESIIWDDASGNSAGTTESIIVCSGGFYNCTVVSVDGCEFNEGFFIEEDFSILVPLVDEVYVLDCETNCVTITTNLANNPNAYAEFTLPNGGIITTHTAEVCEIGTVELEIENLINGCTSITSISIEEKQAPDFTMANSFTIHCSPNVELVIDGDNTDIASYEWTGPGIDGLNYQNASPSISSVGEYTVELTNNDGCKQLLTTVVDQVEFLEFDQTTSPACFDSNSGSVNISILNGGIAPYMFNVDDRDWQEESIIVDLASGTHMIRVLNADGCVVQKEITVNEIPAIIINESLVPEQVDLCTSNALEIDLRPYTFNGVNIQWNDGDSSAIKVINSEGNYSFEITSECETIARDIEISDSRLDEDRLIYIPNTFSPNEDGVNDQFVLSTPHQLESFEIAIYDRWGSKVFESTDLDKSWEGKVLSQGGLNGSYRYLLNAEVESCSEDNIIVKKVGSITVLK